MDGRGAAALRQGRPGFAAVDVYEDVPVLGADHPLIGMANALCTPHLGYVGRGSYEALYGAAVGQILASAILLSLSFVRQRARAHAFYGSEIVTTLPSGAFPLWRCLWL